MLDTDFNQSPLTFITISKVMGKLFWTNLVNRENCLQRNGADFAVFVNTASEFDGSDSGARPDEAVSWGKIKKTASPVKVSTLRSRQE